MIPAGYLLKRIAPPPDYLSGANADDVCSVSGCVNDDIVDLYGQWKQNEFGVASTPDILWSLAASDGCDTSDANLFYYEAYEQELDSDGVSFDPKNWRPLIPSNNSSIPLLVPPKAKLVGYDVVVFGDTLEHSPLSCQSIAAEVTTNQHCLFKSFEEAKAAIEDGVFVDCKPGIYRIFSVHIVS